MKARSKGILILFLILFFSTQFYLTIFGGFLWPFSGHRLFSQRAVPKKTIVQAVLVDSKGNQYLVHPGKVIPIEYSRCSGLIRKLHKEGSYEKQSHLCYYLLKRLNENPWTAFDEMFSAIRPRSSKAKFINLHFEHHTIEFVSDAYPNSIHLLERRPLFP